MVKIKVQKYHVPDSVSIFFVESLQQGFVRNTVMGKLDPKSNPLYGFRQLVKLYLPLLLMSTMRLKWMVGDKHGVMVPASMTPLAGNLGLTTWIYMLMSALAPDGCNMGSIHWGNFTNSIMGLACNLLSFPYCVCFFISNAGDLTQM